MPYAEYLQTPWWKVRRNRALSRVKYCCERCQVNRELQVHHTSYERLGQEADEDLQVLCRGCHLGHHVAEITTNRSVYLAIISDALKAERYTHLADLVEDVKVRCAKLRIPYSDGQVQAAIARLDDERLRLEVPQKYTELLDDGRGGEPLTPAEAAGWMVKLGAIAKTIPNVPSLTPHQAAAHRASEIVAREIIESIQRCEDAERAVRDVEAKAAV